MFQRLTVFVVALMLTLSAAGAQEAETAVIRELFGEAPARQEMFDESFLRAVPYAQIQPILDQTKAAVGPVLDVQHRGGANYALITEAFEQPVLIELTPEGKIASLLLRGAVSRTGSIEDALAGLAEVAPTFAYLVTRDGETLFAHEAEAPLAVGSGFKLGIVAALNDQIAAGTRHWTDVVVLDAQRLSLPTGILQGFPPGSPLTVHTLAALMVSMSDNTATDALLDLVGREAVEARLGIEEPVLSTRELFILKANDTLRERWIAGDAAAKRALLEEVVHEPLPSVAAILTPHDQGLEYYLPLNRLCALIDEVGGLDVMQINPGVASLVDWAEVAFKGGSEIGVLHFSTRVTGEDGHRYCVAATFNAPGAIDEAKAVGVYAAVLARLARVP